MSERNGKPLPPPYPDPMLRAVGDVIAKQLHDQAATMRKEFAEQLSAMRPEVKNFLDWNPMANSLALLGDSMRQVITWQKPPVVKFDADEIRKALSQVVEQALSKPQPTVNFDLSQLTKALAGVVERSLDLPMPAVNVDTTQLAEVVAQAMAASQSIAARKLPDTHVHNQVDLSELSVGLQALTLSQQRTAEAMESVAVLLQSLAAKISRLEAVVSTPRQPRKLRIVHDDGTESNIEETV